MTPSFPPGYQLRVLGSFPVPLGLTPTGLSPSMAPLSRGLRLHPKGTYGKVPQPHIYLALRQGIRFALCRFRSPLLTASRLVSFPPGTKMFQFPGFPLASKKRRVPRRAGIPIRASPDQRLRAPTRGLSQLATPFVGSLDPAIHHLGLRTQEHLRPH